MDYDKKHYKLVGMDVGKVMTIYTLQKRDTGKIYVLTLKYNKYGKRVGSDMKELDSMTFGSM